MDREPAQTQRKIRWLGHVGPVRIYTLVHCVITKSLPRGSYSCTSNGALRLTNVREGSPQHTTTSLPMRLCNWRLGPNQQTFAYGGDEVELSVWDTEKAFSSQPEADSLNSIKRKRGTDLLPAEIWRAKNASRVV